MTDAAKDQNQEPELNEEAVNDSATQEAEAAAEPEQSENDPIAQLTKERDDMRDKMMRALAEAENTRRRAEKAQQDTSKFAIAGFAKDMLDIADNLRRAIDAVPEAERENHKVLLDGVEATERMMLSAFDKHGLQKIEPREGKFDPNFHEVMFEAETPGKPHGEIIQLLEAGYVLNGRLLRPARVGVAKAANPDDHKVDTQV